MSTWVQMTAQSEIVRLQHAGLVSNGPKIPSHLFLGERTDFLFDLIQGTFQHTLDASHRLVGLGMAFATLFYLAIGEATVVANHSNENDYYYDSNDRDSNQSTSHDKSPVRVLFTLSIILGNRNLSTDYLFLF
jgi:hypothetical protein